MRTVWKVELRAAVEVVRLPAGAVPLTVATQNGSPCVWLEVNTDGGEHESRTFTAHGTGHPVPGGGTYIGTAHDVEGVGLVFHVYERTF